MGIKILETLQEGDYIGFDIHTKHPTYAAKYDIWETCRDCHEGEDAVKSRGEKYLPMLSGQDSTEYDKYKMRALYTNFTYRTVESYLGMLFRKGIDLEFIIDEEQQKEFDKYMKDKLRIITEDGKSFYNFIHDLVEEIVITNRVGVLLDTPTIDPMVLESMTLEDYNQKKIKPLLAMYKTETIFNWHTETKDGQVIPTVFVLYEPRSRFVEGSLKVEQVDAYRVLFLENWDDEENRRYKSITIAEDERGVLKVEKITYPRKDGEYIKYIPFFVFTDRGLDYRFCHNPMIKDLASVNLAHYRNSADYENELHFVGIKTIYFAGWDKAADGQPHMGGALAGPPGSEPTLIEPQSDSSLAQALDSKSRVAAALGAERLSFKGRYVASAETARITQSAESAILANMVINLNEVLSRVLQMWMDWHKPLITLDGFVGELDCKVILSNDFTEDTISGADALNWLSVLHQGGISFEQYYEMMKKREVYEPGWTVEKEKEALMKTQIDFTAAAGRNIIQGGTDNPYFTKLRQQIEEEEGEIENEEPEQDSGTSNRLTRGRGPDQIVPERGTKARVRVS